MKIVEKHISPLIESQFPDFYKDQGPLFILFVEEYFKWLESNDNNYASYDGALIDGNPIYHARKLLEYRDIDLTVEEFLLYFKEKYLKGVQQNSNVSLKKLVKAAQDIFSSKGSKRSLDLLFELVYGVKIEIYAPGDDILKVSDGTWVVPVYLELSRSPRTLSYVGKSVRGSSSGATAFVEYLITRNINGHYIDVVFLSNIKGNFSTGEALLDDGLIDNAPTITGSLTSIDITVPGEGFSVGEEVNIVSSRGVEGKARITAVSPVTGIVRFTLIDGGWGYSLTADTTVSTKTFAISNTTNANTLITDFYRFEQVSQNLYSFSLTNVTGNISNSSLIVNGDSGAPSLSFTVQVQQNTSSVAAANSANVILNQISNNVFSNNIVYDKNRSIVVTARTSTFNVGDRVVNYETANTSNVGFGIIQSVANVIAIEVDSSSIGSNGLHVGTFIRQQNTSATGIISAIARENYFTFTNVNFISVSSVSGTFNNTDTINVFSNSVGTSLGYFDVAATQGIYECYQYVLTDTNENETDDRWSTGNIIIKFNVPTVNNSILIASDIGGLVSSCTDISATANLIGSNTTSAGIIDAVNNFYGGSSAFIYGLESNTYAKLARVYTGSSADFNVGVIDNTETVRLSPDFIYSNNDGLGANSVRFSDMIICGANSTYGNVKSVFIESGGSGYTNDEVVVFTGGNTALGYEAANGVIITDSSGTIVGVTLSANTGNSIITTPSVSVKVSNTVNTPSSGTGANLIPTFSLGFVKLPSGDITTPLIDLLRFNNKTIGSIVNFSGVNPGENYNANPFVITIEPEVAAYGKRDIILTAYNLTGSGFAPGEVITQTIEAPAIQIVANGYSGNTANNFEVGEIAYTANNTSNNIASGVVFSSTYDSNANTYTIVLVSNTGTFSTSDFLKGATTGSNVDIISTSAYTASSLAKGIVRSSNTANTLLTPLFDPVTTLNVKRISLFTEFLPNKIITGTTTGTTANVIGVAINSNTTLRVAGDNANVIANVVAAEGAINSVTVIDSGYGYVNTETIQLRSFDNMRAASGMTNVSRQGVGQGFYSSSRGFISDTKYIQDSEYYQNYSYEIQTTIPLDTYSDILKNVLHIAGKKFFGRVNITSTANLQLTSQSTITIS